MRGRVGDGDGEGERFGAYPFIEHRSPELERLAQVVTGPFDRGRVTPGLVGDHLLHRIDVHGDLLVERPRLDRHDDLGLALGGVGDGHMDLAPLARLRPLDAGGHIERFAVQRAGEVHGERTAALGGAEITRPPLVEPEGERAVVHRDLGHGSRAQQVEQVGGIGDRHLDVRQAADHGPQLGGLELGDGEILTTGIGGALPGGRFGRARRGAQRVAADLHFDRVGGFVAIAERADHLLRVVQQIDREILGGHGPRGRGDDLRVGDYVERHCRERQASGGALLSDRQGKIRVFAHAARGQQGADQQGLGDGFRVFHIGWFF